MEKSLDLTEFDQSVTKLFDILKKVLKIHGKRNLNLTSKRNPIAVRLDLYCKTYNKTSPDDHVWYFSQIYKKFRGPILRGPVKDQWLRNGRIIITYGEDVGMPTNIKIHLSAIYSTSCKIREDVEKVMDDLPGVEDAQELFFPEKILFSLYKIFREIVIPPNDQKKLDEHIETLESMLKDNDSEEDKQLTDSNDTMGNLMNMATDLMGNMGIKVPKDKMPSGSEITGAIGKMLNNPKTKSMLGSMLQKIKDSENIGDVMKEVVNGLGDVKLDPAAKKTLNESIERASTVTNNLISDNEALSSDNGPTGETDSEDDFAV